MGPYRTPAEREKEAVEMSEREMQIRIWKMVLITIAVGTFSVAGCNVAQTVHNNQTALVKAQIDSTPLAKDAAQARYLEAKALSDRAMFEQMAKAQK
jgi:hypothetical protein